MRSSLPQCPPRSASCRNEQPARTQSRAQEAIRQRVTAILPLYRLSRYRPTARPRQVPVQPATDERPQPPIRPPSRLRLTPRHSWRCSDRPAPGERAPRAPTRPAGARTRETRDSRRRRSASPTSRGSPPATDPARSATSKIRPPATTSTGMSSPSTLTSARSPT